MTEIDRLRIDLFEIMERQRQLTRDLKLLEKLRKHRRERLTQLRSATDVRPYIERTQNMP